MDWNSMDCDHGVAKSRTRLSDFHFLSLKDSNIGQILESEQWKITLPGQLGNFPTYVLPKVPHQSPAPNPS